MISRAKLKERLLDMASGAGMYWQPDEYWEDFEMAALNRFMRAVEESFDLPQERVQQRQFLEYWEDLDQLTTRIHELIAISER